MEKSSRSWVPPFAAPLPALSSVHVEPVGDHLEVVATKQVLADDPYMAGHFPGLCIYPGVFIIETACQAVAAAHARAAAPPVLSGVRSARFLAPILSGDTLSITTAVPAPSSSTPFDIEAVCVRADGTKVALLKLSFTDQADVDRDRSTQVARPRLANDSGGLTCGQVRDVLPQGHPMVLVDRVLSLRVGGSIETIKAITHSECCYSGLAGEASHAYPTTLLLESLGQSAAILWLTTRQKRAAGNRTLMLALARDVDIKGVARPGDVVTHVATLENIIGDNVFVSGETWVGDRRIIRAGCMAAVMREPIRLDCDTVVL